MDIGKLFRDAWGLFTKDIGPLIVGMLIASIIPAVAATVVAVVALVPFFSSVETNAQGDVTAVDTSGWVALSVGTVVIVVVAVFLTVPLAAGLLEGVLRRVREGRQMAYGDAFNGFRIFWRVVGTAVLLGVILGVIVLVPTAIIVAAALAEIWVLLAFGIVLVVAAMVLYIYLGVNWTYVFPVIVDRGLGATESMAESRTLVRASGWWWTFLALFVLEVVAGAVSTVLGFIPLVGAIATIVLYPFVLTYLVAMYFQARGEGQLVDVVTGYRPPVPGGMPAYSQGAAPYAPPAPAPMPPAAPLAAPAPPPAPLAGPAWLAAPAPAPAGRPAPLDGAGQEYVPPPPPVVPGAAPDVAPGGASAAPPEAPPAPSPPLVPEPPTPPAAPPPA